MEFLKVGLQVITYFVLGGLISKITLGVQEQLREQNNEEPLDDSTRSGIAGLVTPFWPVFLGILLLYVVLALVMNVFSRLMKPFV